MIGFFFKIFLLALVSFPASAHIMQTSFSGFYEGILHPLSGLDHFLVITSIGLWASQRKEETKYFLPINISAALILGASLGFNQILLPFTETIIACSVLTLGILLFKKRTNLFISFILINFFLVFHGHAHGREFSHTAQHLTYSAGFLLSSLLLYLFGLVLGWVLNFNRFKTKILQASGVFLTITGSTLIQMSF